MSTNISIKVQDKVNGPIGYESYDVLRERILNGDKTFDYKGFELKITSQKDLGYYCGYVVSIPSNILEKLSEDERDDLSMIDGIYEPYGGFTDPNGFDCVHHMDLIVGEMQFNLPDKLRENSKASFKSEYFVESELKHIVDSIIKSKR